MAKNLKNGLLFPLLVFGLFMLSASNVLAAEYVFSDNFSGDFNIDRGQSNFVLIDGALYAPSNFISSKIVSNRIISTSYNIGSAKLEVSNFFSSGGRIVYFLSNDDGITWTTAQLGNFVNFSSFGKTVRWSAVIARQDIGSASPSIKSVKITARESSVDLSRSNDSKRISDLSGISRAIADFYKDYGVYPHVSGSDAKTRWNELMILLSRNRNGGRDPYSYISSVVNDPLKDTNDSSYDYKDLSQNDYILATTLELSDNSALNRDLDGIIGGINCNDPVYCIGVLRNSNPGSNGVVLGASITNGNRTVATGGVSGLNLNGIVAFPLNNLLGDEIFRFGDYNEGTISNQENSGNIVFNSNNGNNNVGVLARLPLSKSKSNGNLTTSNGKVKGASIDNAAGVNTGTSDSLIISLTLSGLATILYAYYTTTNLFKRRQALATINKIRLSKSEFNFV